MFQLKLSLLGPPRVRLDQQVVESFRSRKELALLAYIAVEARYAHSRETVAGLLWPDSPMAEARANLRVTLTRLRKSLNAERGLANALLKANRTTVQFTPHEQTWLDVAEFDELVAAAARHGHVGHELCTECTNGLARAAALYEGEFLEGFYLDDCEQFEEWISVQRERYRVAVLTLLSRLSEHSLATGQPAIAYRHAQRQVELDPLREQAHGQLMRALAAQRDHNSALNIYARCCRILLDELGVEPDPATTALAEEIKAAKQRLPTAAPEPQPQLSVNAIDALKEPAVPPTAQNGSQEALLPTRHNLRQPLTPFLGREAELAHLQKRLTARKYRLFTVVGPGGIGKSRLALQVAFTQIDAFRDGLFFVPLAQVQSVANLPAAIAEALALPLAGDTQTPQQQLQNLLRNRHLLLLLDNFEHLIEGTELLLEILQNAPDVTLLVTSRERLNVQAEDLFMVRGLPVPSTDRSDLQHGSDDSAGSTGECLGLSAIDQAASVRLFLDRAQRLQKEFQLTEDNWPDVVRICRLVEGMPLGIELAATWVRDYSCAEIVAELAAGLDILATSLRDMPPHHRSMRSAFDYSWRLLSSRERQVLAQLAAFRGGFTRQAAEAVTGAKTALLIQLHHKSLLQNAGSGRYIMHELLRQFAEEKLQAERAWNTAIAGTESLAASTRAAHSRYYLELVAQQTHRLRQWSAKDAATLIRCELDNIRHGWQWALTQADAGLLNSSIAGLSAFYQLVGFLKEGEALFLEAAQTLEERQTHGQEQRSHQLVGRLLLHGGIFQNQMKYFAMSLQTIEAALVLLEDPQDRALACIQMGQALLLPGDYAAVRAWVEKGLAIASKIGQLELEALALIEIGFVDFQCNHYRAAEEKLQRAIAIGQQLEMPHYTRDAIWILFELLFAEHELGRALAYLQQLERVVEAMGDRKGETLVASGLSMTYGALGMYEEAIQRAKHGEQIAQEMGDDESESYFLQILCDIYRSLGKLDKAEACGERALRLATDLQSSQAVAYASDYLAMAQMEREEFEAAALHYRRACQLFLETGKEPSRIAPLAGLAYLFLQRGQLDGALTTVDEILTLVARLPVRGERPQPRVYWSAYLTLRAAQDPRAGTVLQQGHALLQRTADGLTDDGQRRSFLNRVAINRALVAEWQMVAGNR